METTPIIDLTDPDTEKTETLVEKSGVKLWLQPKTWTEKAKDNKLKIALATTTAILLIFTSTLAVIQTNKVGQQKKTITTLEKRNTQLKSDLTDAETAQATAENKVYTCQASLVTAWKAWDRRNSLIGTVLSNIFSDGNSALIEEDNTLVALDFLNTEDCNPYMSRTEIFKSAN